MRVTRLLYILLMTPACGGVTKIDQPTAGSAGGAGGALAGGAGASGALAAGAEAALPAGGAGEIIGDPDRTGGQYPTVPGSSSSFFWRRGLGNWSVSYSDGTFRDASAEDVIPPRGESKKAYHVIETTPGTSVDLWVQLNHPQGTGVDLSSYTAISFWARLASLGELTVAFGADGRFSGVDPVLSRPRKIVSASETWAQFVVNFDELHLDPTSVSSIDFVVNGRQESFDLWVDELGFLCKGPDPAACVSR